MRLSAIALLTDFGLSDPYVGVMKGVLARLHPPALLLDITHSVPPQNVRMAALFLDSAWPWFPPGTVFLCVVDPGVGTPRRGVVAAAAGHLFVGPDNGLFSLLPAPQFREITAAWGAPVPARTFHGRDLFAPVAARLAGGAPFADVGPLVTDPVRVEIPAAVGGRGEVLFVDHYGNAVTNLAGCEGGLVRVAGLRVPVCATYGDAGEGASLAVTGSTGRLEIAVRNGSAARDLGIGPGTPVSWEAE